MDTEDNPEGLYNLRVHPPEGLDPFFSRTERGGKRPTPGPCANSA